MQDISFETVTRDVSSATLYLLIALFAILLFNGAAFLLYRSDKRKARNGEWRVSESNLLLVSFFGPFGAYYSMRKYHHKTKKLKFVLVPVFMFMQVAVVVFFLMNQWYPVLS